MKSRISRSRSDGRSRRIAYFVEDPGSQARFQTLRRRKVHRTIENLSQSVAQGGELEKVWYALEFDEDVDIAIRTSLAPCDRPEHANSSNAGTGQLGAMRRYPLKEFSAIHGQLVGEV
jgi:hypothetical protein